MNYDLSDLNDVECNGMKCDQIHLNAVKCDVNNLNDLKTML